MTWNADEACDLTPDEDFDGYEAVFGSIAPDVVNGWLIIYQRDFEPGLHVRGDEDPADINIVHLRIPAEDLGDCMNWKKICRRYRAHRTERHHIVSQPADDQVELVINRPGAHQIDVWSMTGSVFSPCRRALVERIETSDWAPGIYLVNIAQGDHQAVVRLAIQ